MKTKDLYQKFTDSILRSLKNGIKPWDAHVALALPENALSGQPYRGFNVLTLWVAQAKFGFSCHRYVTFNQALLPVESHRKANGLHVNSKETIRHRRLLLDNEGKMLGVRKGGFTKPFTVFNIDQLRGYDTVGIVREPDYNELGKLVERFRIDCPIHVESANALCESDNHFIVVPSLDRFEGEHAKENFYATLLHEMIHSTSKALDRKRCKRFGDRDYCFEELVAKLGAAFLQARFEISGEHCQHDSYIGSWIKGLENDPSYIKDAASLAEEAVTYLLKGILID